MNRRELGSATVAALFGAASAYPIAVAAVEHSESAAPAVHADSDDDIFHAVYMYDPGKQDFVVRGIYTLTADADAHVARLTAAGHKPVGHVIANRQWLQNQFISERMDGLKDVLERIEARLMIDAHHA